MDTRARELIRIGNALYTDRQQLLSLWQEIALNCYPERATFTEELNAGAEFADHLFGSFPSLARRELGNSYSAILRPTNLGWFEAHIADEDKDKYPEHRAYLEYITRVMRRAMYDPPAQFVRSTKQADHDLAAFGNAALEGRASPDRSRLVYRSFHLRDVAWSEDVTGMIDLVFRKWQPTARQLCDLWPTTVSDEVKKANEKDPEKRFSVIHMVVPTRVYRAPERPGGARELPYTCFYIEETAEKVLEETPEPWFSFVVPRWQTISGSQYARSPATEITLPDARTFQAMIRTLREAGEMHVNPPMVAVTDAVRGDIQLFAGGVTAVDIEYDEKAGPALKAIDRNPGTMPIGIEMAQQVREDIRLGFFLDKLTLPKIDPQKMTAYEFQQRIEQMAREGAPIFDPIEDDYNAPLCDLTFTVMKANGAFGPASSVPKGLRGNDVKWRFRSPYREATEQAKAGLFVDGLQRVLAPAAAIDPAQIENIDMTTAVRDSLHGLGYPETWFKPPTAVAEKQMALQRQKEMAAGIGTVAAGGQAAQSAAAGAGAVSQAVQAAVSPTSPTPG